jgi:hypothetical protein
MSVLTKRSWSRRAVFTGAVLATAALTTGVMSRSAAAQYGYDYGYGYPGTVYSYSPYSYPSYSYPYYPGYHDAHHWHGGWGEHRGGWDRDGSGRGWDHGGWHNGGRGQEAHGGWSGGDRGGGRAFHDSGSTARGNEFLNRFLSHSYYR